MSEFLTISPAINAGPDPGTFVPVVVGGVVFERAVYLHNRQPEQTGEGTGKPVKIFLRFRSCTYINPDTINRFIRPHDARQYYKLQI